MEQRLSESLLSRLSGFVATQLGLHFPQERWCDLERGVRSVAREFGVADVYNCAARLLSAPLTRAEIEILARELTVGETYFFRENRSFEILGEQILPELIRARQGGERSLRIWSAGCCTGEEPYSIAILLDRLLPVPSQWHVTVLATDVNPRFRQKAAEGIFGEWSFRDPPPWLKENYFKAIRAHRFEIVPRIKKMVTFAYLNLAEDSYPSPSNKTNAMDLIFCRNVLMYFTTEQAQKVIRRFHRSLVEGGKLIVSPTETSAQLFSPFASIHFDGAILYGKESKRPPASATLFRGEAATAGPDEEPGVPVWPSRPDGLSVPDPQPSVFAVSFAEIAPQPAGEAQTIRAKPIIHDEALALFERGDYVEAARKLEMKEATPESSALLARICANLGQLAEALEWIEKAIATDKLDAGLHYLRAIILQEQGVAEESVASFKRALYVDPDLVLAHHALGNLALRQERLKDAARHFANTLVLLTRYDADDVLPHSDGLAAGRLREIVQSAMLMETSV
jgi:chemotaxis protein methyltransferase CheR